MLRSIVKENIKSNKSKLLEYVITSNTYFWIRTCSSDAQLKTKKTKYRNFAKRRKKGIFQKHKLDPNKSHNVALCLAYHGHKYHGMECTALNNAVTVEGKLLKALFEHEFISAIEYLYPLKIHFNRTSRTDAGVSAAKQIVSFRIRSDILERNDIIEKVNSSLPADIRVFALKKMDASFDSQLSCKARTYSYLLPTYALAPINEFVWEKYRITDSVLEFVNKLLQKYVGSHNFFNYSSGCDESKKYYQRTVYDIKHEQPFVRENKEYLLIKIRGRSFIFHQIRKMIGMMIAIARSLAPSDAIEKSREFKRVSVPIAPALGLFLDDLHFNKYNATATEPLVWHAYEDEIETFRKSIINSIVTSYATPEHKHNMLSWLQTLMFYSQGAIDPNVDRRTVFGDISSALRDLQIDEHKENGPK